MNVLLRAAIAVCCLLAAIFSTQALPPPEPTLGPILASVILPTGAISTRTTNGTFQPMAAVPGVTMQVTLQFTSDWANQPVVLQSLDGADISCDNPNIGTDGTLHLAVTPGMQGGNYRVHIILGGLDAVLQLRVPTGDDPPLLVPGVGQ